VLQPILTRWIAGFDSSNVLAVSALFYGVGMAVHGLATVAAVHALAVCVWTIGEILEAPTKSTIVADMSPVSARGRYAGMMVMSWGLSQVVGPRIGTYIWDAVGPSALWFGCLGLGAIVALLLVVTAPARRRRLSRPGPS